jgi:hypothetical protein
VKVSSSVLTVNVRPLTVVRCMYAIVKQCKWYCLELCVCRFTWKGGADFTENTTQSSELKLLVAVIILTVRVIRN